MRGYLLKDGRRSGRWVRRWVDFNESSGVIFTCKSPDDGERPKLLASLLDGATISMVDKAGKPCIAIVPGDGQPRYLAAAAGEQPPLHSWFHRMQSAIMRHHEGPGPSHNATRAPARERREPQRGQAPGRPTPLLRARHSVEATTAVVIDTVDQVRCCTARRRPADPRCDSRRRCATRRRPRLFATTHRTWRRSPASSTHAPTAPQSICSM